MSYKTIKILGRPYECICSGRTGFDSADMPSHSATCVSKAALLIAIPKEYVVTDEGEEFIQFRVLFEIYI